ncbi:MAG: helix-hairpin-helix domain-containing protein [Myxococcales bacterium]|nr:helix-hairpin-helix domain-containing protein [Myxococcales bacterium]
MASPSHHQAAALVVALLAAAALAGARTPRTPYQPPEAPAVDAGAEPVDLNTADLGALDRLPGVGPSLAARIVAARQRRPFRSLADLDRVPGVGPATLRRLAPRVRFGPPDAGPPADREASNHAENGTQCSH